MAVILPMSKFQMFITSAWDEIDLFTDNDAIFIFCPVDFFVK